ncbi:MULTISPECIES: MBG domain-containing protein [Pseudomonadaceae]|uniref:Halomucin n=1 Tax=Ectopseudomonas oleovorans (strain CECT 5344) TaxID=1182590 RepID=W6R2W3_ECTO5|nr:MULTISPECIES: MBG domain-containing protein [Pseudomonas]MDG9759624.1 filamentous hemagglutinin N-terminal domain-containing protein [Pseudomonas sediminis]MDH2200934.1 filamentous hemagglutinin N-terminal domain-containing protein [Pseudomonas oleovorans]CDM42558.1 Halomucin [Pseudomonas oleovorans CECT 5344]CDR93181.1 Halomucin [Pseudomonas oleovorans]
MNRSYALIWNHALGAWAVAHEHARKRGKGAGAILATSLVLAGSTFAADLPTGGQVVSGSGSISQPNGQQMVIDQASNKLAIDWQSFDIGSGNKVTFNQPGTDSIALNRVLGADGSKIMGQLDANGRVFIINPNGVLFGAGAQVNVGGLVASTLDLSVSDFEAGNYAFKGNGSNASVINNGRISAADGGSVALLGGTVSNNGVIVANQGTVALAAGNSVTLDFAGDGLLSVQVDEAVKDALVENRQLIQADGGNVILTASAADALLQTVVNNEGVIQARTLGEKEGRIVLLGDFDGGTVQVAGTLDASAADGGNGGFIDTSGAHVQIAAGTTVTTKATTGQTGTWLIDPTDFTVSAGSASQTPSGIGASTLSANLQNTSITLQTVAGGSENGDINVNAAVSWSADTTLTLDAHGRINVNKDITASGDNAALVLAYGNGYSLNQGARVTLSGGNAGLSLGGVDYTLIRDLSALQGISGNGHYALAIDLDAAATSTWNAGAGFAPIDGFNGTFAGLGHTVDGLFIYRPNNGVIGMFGLTAATIRDLTLSNVSITGIGTVGGLVARLSGGTMTNTHVTGQVSSLGDQVGGLVGLNDQGFVSQSSSTATVSGASEVGGLIGRNRAASVTDAYATGAVTGTGDAIGGLIGSTVQGTTLTNTYASGRVTGTGGLVGNVDGSGATVTNSYWDMDSTGQASSAAGTGIDSTNARTQATYAGFDFTNTWVMFEGDTRPMLRGEYSTTLFTPHALQLMALDLSADYRLGTDLDLGAALAAGGNGYYGDVWGVAGFKPVGNSSTPFTGSLDGQGHLIRDLRINRANESEVALIGQTAAGAQIHDLGLVGGSVHGGFNAASLVGINYGGILSDLHTNVTVSSTARGAGGLVARNRDNGIIRNSYATGDVSGAENVVGGLTGENWGLVENSYATGNISGVVMTGGLVGANTGTIRNAYATGQVQGTEYVGGLAGYNGSLIEYTYATGSVTGVTSVGGLVGNIATGRVADSFWNTDTFTGPGAGSIGGVATVENLLGLDSTALRDASNYATWNLATNGGSNAVWRIYEGHTAPLLRSFMQSVTVTATDIGNKTYDGQNSGTSGYTTDLGDTLNDDLLLGSLTYSSASQNAGSYSTTDGGLSLDGLYSGQQGYDVSYADTTLTIDKAALTVTANDASKTYDGLAFTGGNGVSYSGFVNGEDVGVLGGTLLYGGSAQGAVNAGNYDLSVSGLSADNYAISYTTGGLNVGKAQATITANSGQVTYNGQQQSITGFTASGLVNGETATVLSGISTTGGAGINAGSYTHSATGTDVNYNLTFVDGTLTIDKAALSVTANDASKTYDGLAFTGGNGVSYSGFVNGEDVGVLGGTLLYGGSAQGAVNAGNYGLGVSGLSADNYAISYTTGSLNVGKAQATITANSGQVTYNGQQQSITGFTASGLVNGETATVLSGISTTGGAGINAGSYTHSATGTDVNYNLIFVDGTLTIDKAALSVTANDASKTYDGLAFTGGNGVSYSGFVNGEDVGVLGGTLVYGGSAQGAVNNGSYAISTNGLTSGNYAITFIDGSLTISGQSQGQPSNPAAEIPQAYTDILAAIQRDADSEASTPSLNPDELYRIADSGIRLPEGLDGASRGN